MSSHKADAKDCEFFVHLQLLLVIVMLVFRMISYMTNLSFRQIYVSHRGRTGSCHRWNPGPSCDKMRVPEMGSC